MKFKELTTKPEAEVRKILEELREQAHELAVKMRQNQTKDTSKMRGLRRDIARVLTHLHNLTSK